MRVIPLLIVCDTLLVAGHFCGSTAHAQGATENVWPTREWPTSSAEAQGMDSADLAGLVAFGTTRSFDGLIARHGIVLDAYYPPYTADIPHATRVSANGRPPNGHRRFA
jgi:hypothetical protein